MSNFFLSFQILHFAILLDKRMHLTFGRRMWFSCDSDSDWDLVVDDTDSAWDLVVGVICCASATTTSCNADFS